MSAKAGRDVLIKLHDGSNFITIGGMRTQRFSLNSQSIDTTHAQSVGQWRQLLAGGGLKSAALNGQGVFTDNASDGEIQAIFFNGDIRDYELILPDFGTISGLFQLTQLEYNGDFNNELTYEITLESAGQLNFTSS